MADKPQSSLVTDVTSPLRGDPSLAELPDSQQWFWVGRVSLRVTASMWAEIERLAAAHNLPSSAIARHVMALGLSTKKATDAS